MHAHQTQAADLDFAIFLEDDAILPANGISQLIESASQLSNMDSHWDLFYFGREKLYPDIANFGEFVRPNYSYCTYAYALTRTGIAKLLAYDPLKKIMPLDEFIPATYVRHPRPDVATSIAPTLAAYALSVDLVTEAPKQIFGSDTEDSPFIMNTCSSSPIHSFCDGASND